MFGIDSDSAGGNATRGSVSGEPGGGTGTDPQESNKNLAMGCTRRGEGAAVYRSSLPLVLALVVLMVLPAHGVAARTESSALPTMADAVGPHGGTAAPALNRAAPPMPSGGPPRGLYPSDDFRTASDGLGPVPALSSAIDRHGFPAAWA